VFWTREFALLSLLGASKPLLDQTLGSLMANQRNLGAWLATALKDPAVRAPVTALAFDAGGRYCVTAGAAARLYDITGDASMRGVSEFFWQTVTTRHSYVIGGNSQGEFFGEAGKIASKLSERTCESCNTYNMLKLTRSLFLHDPRPEYADYYERTLFNGILASQDGFPFRIFKAKSGEFHESSSFRSRILDAERGVLKTNRGFQMTKRSLDTHIHYGHL
jgi:hypothetical protein